MKNNKEKVVILNYIDKSNTAFNVDKINKLREENLIQYCKDENYEIVKIFKGICILPKKFYKNNSL